MKRTLVEERAIYEKGYENLLHQLEQLTESYASKVRAELIPHLRSWGMGYVAGNRLCLLTRPDIHLSNHWKSIQLVPNEENLLQVLLPNINAALLESDYTEESCIGEYVEEIVMYIHQPSEYKWITLNVDNGTMHSIPYSSLPLDNLSVIHNGKSLECYFGPMRSALSSLIIGYLLKVEPSKRDGWLCNNYGGQLSTPLST
jgi:hypothetical protein